MEALDLVQTLFSHQPVLRSLQIKQRDFYPANFFPCIAVYGGTRPFCENIDIYGAHGAAQRKLQALGCTMAQDEIFAQKIRRAEPKEQRPRQQLGHRAPLSHGIRDETGAEDHSGQVGWMRSGEFYGHCRSVGFAQDRKGAVPRNKLAEPGDMFRIGKKSFGRIRRGNYMQSSWQFRDQGCKKFPSPV